MAPVFGSKRPMPLAPYSANHSTLSASTRPRERQRCLPDGDLFGLGVDAADRGAAEIELIGIVLRVGRHAIGIDVHAVLVVAYFATTPWYASHSRAAEAGMSRCAPAPPGIASATAFITAEIAAVVPASPTPLTPSGLVVAGTLSMASRSGGMSSARGIA